jgi:gamma-glutamylcyclotransferase (GGCT)/AIG2-like uncharacterized protein YtfP
MSHLFAYGTLMCEDIMMDVTGCRLSVAAGVLTGYSRRRVKGQGYPALVARANHSVEGVVYLDLPTMAWWRLDRFEGEMYMREEVQVEMADGQQAMASTYVVHPDFIHQLGPDQWHYEQFLRDGKARLQEQYRGYGEL